MLLGDDMMMVVALLATLVVLGDDGGAAGGAAIKMKSLFTSLGSPFLSYLGAPQTAPLGCTYGQVVALDFGR